MKKKIMRICKSENVVNLYDSLETDDSIILVLELCDCNLSEYFDKKLKSEKKVWILLLLKKYLMI